MLLWQDGKKVCCNLTGHKVGAEHEEKSLRGELTCLYHDDIKPRPYEEKATDPVWRKRDRSGEV